MKHLFVGINHIHPDGLQWHKLDSVLWDDQKRWEPRTQVRVFSMVNAEWISMGEKLQVRTKQLDYGMPLRASWGNPQWSMFDV